MKTQRELLHVDLSRHRKTASTNFRENLIFAIEIFKNFVGTYFREFHEFKILYFTVTYFREFRDLAIFLHFTRII